MSIDIYCEKATRREKLLKTIAEYSKSYADSHEFADDISTARGN